MKISRRFRGVVAGIALAVVSASGVAACAPAPRAVSYIKLNAGSGRCTATVTVVDASSKILSVIVNRGGSNCRLKTARTGTVYGARSGFSVSDPRRPLQIAWAGNGRLYCSSLHMHPYSGIYSASTSCV